MRLSPPRWCLGALAAGLVACGDSTAPTVAESNDPSYSISLNGDVRNSVHGVPTALRVANGYRESGASGRAESTAVVFVQLASADASQPRLAVGLMGTIQPGTYTLRAVGGSIPGSQPEFYASVSDPGTDGTRNYTVTSGTVTLTSVGATLHGKFTLHSGAVVFVPPNSAPGTVFRPAVANLDATGTFVVPAPLGVVP